MSDHDIKQAARRYAPEAIEQLASLMRSDDAMASVAAAAALIDVALGKPGLMSPEETPGVADSLAETSACLRAN